MKNQPNIPPDLHGCYGRQFEVPPRENTPHPLTQSFLYMIGWYVSLVHFTVNLLDNPIACHKYKLNRLPAVRLSSLSCIYQTCFFINSDNKTALFVDIYFSPTEHWIYRGSMSKDNRHDGRRRGAGQHRLGPRVSQGGDGRERSGSNSSGSSHGGGKSKNASITALKVCIDTFFAANIGNTAVNSVKNIRIRLHS